MPEWKSFSSNVSNIFELNGKRKSLMTNLFKKWIEKHQFWYDKLPNNIYNNCLNEIDKNQILLSGDKSSSNIISVNFFLLTQSIWFFQVW